MLSFSGTESHESLAKLGVPLGSILGPLVFIMFINDLPFYVSSQIDLYADDTTITANLDFRHIPRTFNEQISKLNLALGKHKQASSKRGRDGTGERLAPKLHDLPYHGHNR